MHAEDEDRIEPCPYLGSSHEHLAELRDSQVTNNGIGIDTIHAAPFPSLLDLGAHSHTINRTAPHHDEQRRPMRSWDPPL